MLVLAVIVHMLKYAQMGTLPPRCPPAHACAASGTHGRRLSPGTHRAYDRDPPAPRSVCHAFTASLVVRPR
jgi:hypothetical protein